MRLGVWCRAPLAARPPVPVRRDIFTGGQAASGTPEARISCDSDLENGNQSPRLKEARTGPVRADRDAHGACTARTASLIRVPGAVAINAAVDLAAPPSHGQPGTTRTLATGRRVVRRLGFEPFDIEDVIGAGHCFKNRPNDRRCLTRPPVTPRATGR